MRDQIIVRMRYLRPDSWAERADQYESDANCASQGWQFETLIVLVEPLATELALTSSVEFVVDPDRIAEVKSLQLDVPEATDGLLPQRPWRRISVIEAGPNLELGLVLGTHARDWFSARASTPPPQHQARRAPSGSAIDGKGAHGAHDARGLHCPPLREGSPTPLSAAGSRERGVIKGRLMFARGMSEREHFRLPPRGTGWISYTFEDRGAGSSQKEADAGLRCEPERRCARQTPSRRGGERGPHEDADLWSEMAFTVECHKPRAAFDIERSERIPAPYPDLSVGSGALGKLREEYHINGVAAPPACAQNAESPAIVLQDISIARSEPAKVQADPRGPFSQQQC
ncbi:hypothetical protein POSPLADRAFT_1048445 [Postia placenta MAD-698-R-SB12]|uniref:Uncharacterized protein n=1 Tax=Postia placenta MAD-698-R-SB12 TaxID=670580 RepID=A0A1X6MUE9_9APHY|nr:hypothetical protein POSPLADRAFT_1048445 [Postia placenta MAD-698-R-SB12]OSX60005.1 hypothetical protein POSPLADRAFT_1048445 [Postia placenta MAD-698-R-SB12]